ncbi:MAG: hypothetical protein NTX24_02735 [Candidatus Pacearchaeota archaeon]|nr:hypothetical protein [Candidatus Pacearchaeota archaeon]
MVKKQSKKIKKKSWIKRHPVWTVVIIVFVFIGLIGMFTEEGEPTSFGLRSNDSIENQSFTDSNQTMKCAGQTKIGLNFEQICINLKLDKCTKLCAGEDIEIPAVKDECYSSCYQIYYYGGEKELDNLIEDYKG